MNTVLASCLLLCLLVAAFVQGEKVFVYTNGQCLSLSPDHRSVNLAMCGSNSNQLWDLSSGERLQLDQLCLDSYLQMSPCSNDGTQSWWFSPEGKITLRMNQANCLATSGQTVLLGLCSTQTAGLFYASTVMPASQLPSSQLPTFNSGLPPMNNGLPQQPPLSRPLPPPPSQQQPVSNLIQTVQTSSGVVPRNKHELDVSSATSPDHYLCVCISDASDESCDQAVRSACLVGHLPEKLCAESFSKGKHDRVSDAILKLVDNGNKCSEFDIAQLRKDQRKEIKGEFSPEGLPTQKDHYLCICLDLNQPKKCRFAVQSACLVGHIPAGDCRASLENENHEGASQHVLKLISQGAACSQQLRLNAIRTNAPTSYSLLGGSKTSEDETRVTKRDRDLCACLDDFDSEECDKAVARACSKGRIPKEDCEVSTKNYDAGVTRHLLRIIDHGAECPAHRSMTFTNHGCHCLQSWTDGKEVLSFPNNCADPRGERGFAWCKTYESEHCPGVDGSITWDRCDIPKYPKFNQQNMADQGEHYLCVCLAESSTDEVCVAAARSACEVGHLPAEACERSFANNHDQVSDSILDLLNNGQRCSKETLQSLVSNVALSDGSRCAEGYFGFPNCRPKLACTVDCSKLFGKTCDFAVGGECVCLPNFVGKDCNECVKGTSGRHCLPDSELLDTTGVGAWQFFQYVFYLMIVYWMVSSCCRLSSLKLAGERAKNFAYSKLQRKPAAFSQTQRYAVVPPDGRDSDMDEEDDIEADFGDSSAVYVPDLGTDAEPGKAHKTQPVTAKPQKQQQQHTGMAV